MVEHIGTMQRESMESDTGKDVISSLDSETFQEFVGTAPTTHWLRSVATAIGHAHETTTLSSYVHCVGRLVGEYCSAQAPMLSDYAVSYGLEIKHATVRRRRSRDQDEDPYSLGANRSARNAIPEPSVITHVYKGDCPRRSDRETVEKITLIELDLLLRRYGESAGDVGTIARKLLLEPNEARIAVDNAIELERASGYSLYNLEEKIRDPILRSAATVQRRKKILGAETRRLRTLLKEVSDTVQSLGDKDASVLRNGIAVWVKTYQPTSGTNLVTELSEFTNLSDAIKLLPFRPKYQVRVDTHSLVESELMSHLARHGVEIAYAAIPKAAEKTARRRHGRAEVRMDFSETPLRVSRTFHRLMFILGVCTKL